MKSMNKPRGTSLTASLVILGLLTPTLSYAQMAVVDGPLTLVVQGGIGTLSGAISAAATASSQSINTQLAMVIKGAQGATATSISRAAELQADAINRTVHSNERAKQEGRFQYTDPCSIPAASQGMSEVMGTTITSSASLGYGGGRGGGSFNGAMKRVVEESTGVAPARDPGATAISAAKGACETFASSSGNAMRASACQTAGYSAGNSSGYADGDVRAETVVYGPQKTGQAMRIRHTLDPDSKDLDVVNAYVRNLSSPLQMRDLNRGELSTDEGKKYMALKDIYDARMSMATHPMRRNIGMMTASATTIPVLNALMESQQGTFVQNYLNKEFPNWRAKGISEDQLMDLEVQRRYMNLDWQTRMAAASPEEVSREQLQLTAVQNVLLLNLQREMRENGLVLSTMATAQTRQEMVPQLVQQHRAAAR